jgi:hypothetical protein
MGARAGHEYGPDEDVCLDDRGLDALATRVEGHDPATMDLVDPAQAVEVFVEQQHLGLHTGREEGRVPSRDACSEDDHPRRPHARDATEKDARAVLGLQVMRSNMRRHAPGDLAHRREERQASVVRLDGLVTDGYTT